VFCLSRRAGNDGRVYEMRSIRGEVVSKRKHPQNIGRIKDLYKTKIVLVEVDAVESLCRFTRNNFDDVQKFRSRLREIAKRDDEADYSVPPKLRAQPDPSWLCYHRSRK
jgi:hypothetical protein